jgi:hypothetical protein
MRIPPRVSRVDGVEQPVSEQTELGQSLSLDIVGGERPDKSPILLAFSPSSAWD